MVFKSIATAVALSLLALPTSAQQIPPNPPAAGEAQEPSNDPVRPMLMAEEGLTEAEATTFLQMQGEIGTFLSSNGLTSRDDFVDLVVRPKPYQIILTFEREVRVNEIVAEIPQSLRRYVRVRKAKHINSARQASIASLTATLRSVGVEFAVGYDADGERFFIDTANAAATTRLQALIPTALVGDVVFLSGALPVRTQNPSQNATPTGTRSGDWVTAGWGAYTASTNAICTLGFTVTFASGLQGVLTASHCSEPKYVPRGTHNYTFPAAYYESPLTGNYDYAIYRTDGLLSDHQLYYDNKRGTAGFAASGWLSVKDFIRLSNQWVGMYTCKQGQTSGLTCGKVLSKTYDWSSTGSSIWVRLSSSTLISDAGDSGGPAFVTLNSSRPSEVTAAGLVVGGGGPYQSIGYTAVVMPIDRIFDHVPNVRLKTAP